MRKLLEAEDAARGLLRVAGEVAERHRGTQKLMLVGIRRGGVPLATALKTQLEALEPDHTIPLGTLDITLYRDDASTALPNAKIGASHMPVDVDGWSVILIDDVVGTGRSIRAALDALLDYGRPARVEVFALVDRGGRELPIAVNYAVKKLEASAEERVDVHVRDGRISAMLMPASAPSLYPPPVEEI